MTKTMGKAIGISKYGGERNGMYFLVRRQQKHDIPGVVRSLTRVVNV